VGTKISALTAVTSVVSAQEIPVNDAGQTKKASVSQLRQYVGEGLNNASTSTVSAGYAVDTYLAGSAITIPTAGGWLVGTTLRWGFDMAKTSAGSAAPVITVRLGTLGTTGDASIYTFTYPTGTAVGDTGWFDVDLVFRTVGSGTSAVVAGVSRLARVATAGGLINTNSTYIVTPGASSGFNSTTQTIIGLSFNGGASFSGTNTVVTADADKI